MPRIPEPTRATFPIEVPASFAKGTSVVARLQGKGKGGAAIGQASQVPLYVDEPIATA